MKINIKILSVSLLCFALIACDDFLDEKPYSELTEENLGLVLEEGDSIKYKTAVQAESALGGVYSHFKNEFWSLDHYIINENQTDNAYSGEPNENRFQIDEYRIKINNENVTRSWGALYKQIGDANSIITWVPMIPDSEFTGNRKKEIVAEAMFVRALCHFYLIRIYGNVPLVVKDIPEINMGNIDEIYPLLFPEQATPEQVYAQIVADLEYATENASGYSAYKFKATKAVANLLLAEVYATKDGHLATDWNKVKQYASAVVNDSQYGLLNNFDDLFTAEGEGNGGLSSNNLTNENSRESLFEVDYTSWDAGGNWAAQMFIGLGWKKFNTPSKDLVKAFDKEGDAIRKDVSIMFADVTGAWSDKFWASTTYPFCYKLRSEEKGNIILYRFSEAILLLADAENELGNLSTAKSLVDRVRNRVSLPGTTAGSKEAMRLAIENEHRLEFAFEGKRWFDLKRRGRFVQVMKSSTDHQRSYAAALADYMQIWPIPHDEMQANESLIQNPGY